MTLRTIGMDRFGYPASGVATSVCGHCQRELERKAIRIVSLTGCTLVDPEEIVLVYAAGKAIVYELDGGRQVTDRNTSVLNVHRGRETDLLIARHGVLVKRDRIESATRMDGARRDGDWFLQMRGREKLVSVSRRHWPALRRIIFKEAGSLQ